MYAFFFGQPLDPPQKVRLTQSQWAAGMMKILEHMDELFPTFDSHQEQARLETVLLCHLFFRSKIVGDHSRTKTLGCRIYLSQVALLQRLAYYSLYITDLGSLVCEIDMTEVVGTEGKNSFYSSFLLRHGPKSVSNCSDQKVNS